MCTDLNSQLPIFPTDLKMCMILILIIYCYNFWVHILVGVNPYGRCTIVSPLPKIAKLPKKSQNNDSKICDPLEQVYCRSFECGLTFQVIWVEVIDPKTKPHVICKLLSFKTIDIHIMISYIIECQRLNFGLCVVSSNLQTSIQSNLSTIFSLTWICLNT